MICNFKFVRSRSGRIVTINRFKMQDNTLQFKKKTQINLNIIKYISSNSTLQCNLIEGSFIYSHGCAGGFMGGHHKNTCPLWGQK